MNLKARLEPLNSRIGFKEKVEMVRVSQRGGLHWEFQGMR